MRLFYPVIFRCTKYNPDQDKNKMSNLEQVLPARKLDRGGARPGLGTMSTSEQILMLRRVCDSDRGRVVLP